MPAYSSVIRSLETGSNGGNAVLLIYVIESLLCLPNASFGRQRFWLTTNPNISDTARWSFNSRGALIPASKYRLICKIFDFTRPQNSSPSWTYLSAGPSVCFLDTDFFPTDIPISLTLFVATNHSIIIMGYYDPLFYRQTMALCVSLSALSVIAVILRVVARIKTRSPFKADDWWVYISLILFLAYVSVNIWGKCTSFLTTIFF